MERISVCENAKCVDSKGVRPLESIGKVSNYEKSYIFFQILSVFIFNMLSVHRKSVDRCRTVSLLSYICPSLSTPKVMDTQVIENTNLIFYISLLYYTYHIDSITVSMALGEHMAKLWTHNAMRIKDLTSFSDVSITNVWTYDSFPQAACYRKNAKKRTFWVGDLTVEALRGSGGAKLGFVGAKSRPVEAKIPRVEVRPKIKGEFNAKGNCPCDAHRAGATPARRHIPHRAISLARRAGLKLRTTPFSHDAPFNCHIAGGTWASAPVHHRKKRRCQLTEPCATSARRTL